MRQRRATSGGIISTRPAVSRHQARWLHTKPTDRLEGERMAVDGLSYDARHGVVVCRQCRTCLSPDGPRQWRRHLRREPHRLKDERLARAVGLLSTYELRTRDELRRRRPDRRVPCKRIEGLAIYGGYIYLCDPIKCDFTTRRLEMMEDHMPRHGRTAREYHGMGAVLWRSCTL